jgi:hypothetical protein
MAALVMSGLIHGWQGPAEAAMITSLELTGGSVGFDGRFSRKLDRLFEQPGLLIMHAYQPGPDIVPPITKRHRTFSLFTSGIQGAPLPSAIINGSSLTVDLSSFFFGVSKGDRLHAWNIGGVATGFVNPDTLEFCLTWDHLFGDRPRFGLETFSLHGKVNLLNVAAIPIVTTAVLFCTGLAMLVGVWRRKGITQSGRSVSFGARLLGPIQMGNRQDEGTAGFTSPGS